MATVTSEAVEPETSDVTEATESTEGSDEPETGEDEDEEAEAPEASAEPAPQGLSQKDVEQRLERLDREAKRHRDRISEILGEDALALVQCPLCTPTFAGWRFDVPLRDDEKDTLLSLADPTRALDYRVATDARECEACNGLGQVVSGSKVANRELIACSKCNGFGYVNVQTPTTAAMPTAAPVETPPSGGEAAEPLPDLDPFGRPPSDPNYGRLPQYAR